MPKKVDKTENKQKKKKPFLVIGAVLLGVALLIGGGYFITGSIVFARNAIALFLLSGVGVGMGAVCNAAVHKIKGSKKGKKSKQRVRTKTQELQNIPEILETKEKGKEAEIVLENPASNISKKETTKSGR